MTRLLLLVSVFALSGCTPAVDDVTASGRIVVDASKDGGLWWFPQEKDGFDHTKDHQGKRFADYLKSRGWEVEEIARGEDVTERLKNAAIVIRASLSGEYKESEIHAYREYVTDGGNLFLLRGGVRPGEENHDKVAKEFGIVFSGTVQSATIERWEKHPLTEELDLLPYKNGSIVTESSKSSVPIAYLDNNQLVMGIVKSGKGKVVFVSTITPLLAVPQPFVERVLEELTPKD